MAKAVEVSHRAGAWKQQNKDHKHGRHRTKSQIKADQKGKVSLKAKNSRRQKPVLTRRERKNLSKQIRAHKVTLDSSIKSKVGTHSTPPILVAFVPVSRDVNTSEWFKTFISFLGPDAKTSTNARGDVHVVLVKQKVRFTFLKPVDEFMGVLDSVKVANTVVFLHGSGINGAELVDEEGRMIVAAIRAQGLPTVLHVMPKDNKMKTTRKAVESVVSPEDRVAHFLGNEASASSLLRVLATQKRREVGYIAKHSHIIADSVEFCPLAQDGEEVAIGGSVKISGYIRGSRLDLNKFVHIPDYGDFKILRVTLRRDPLLEHVARSRSSSIAMEDTSNLDEVLITPDASNQDDVDLDEELDDGDEMEAVGNGKDFETATMKSSVIRKVPKGTSDYQAAWIVDSGDECSGDEAVDEFQNMDEDMNIDEDGEDSSEEGEKDEDTQTEIDDRSEIGSVADMPLSQQMDLLAKLKQMREDEMFPDEEDTPMDISARERYQKYRGLESFRRSVWENPDSDLPPHYKNLYRFANFKRSRKLAIAEPDEETGISSVLKPGAFVTLELGNVTEDVVERMKAIDRPILAFGLLSHEHRMSILNCVLKRRPAEDPENATVIKSKDRLVFQVGFRRFTSCPVFSEHKTGNKFKMERFWRPGQIVTASFVAPISFPPAPVIVWTPNCKNYEVVGTGRVLDADPGRIIVKRAVLSGYPFKIQSKRNAVVRFMFFNREDIMWFKPVELRTKHGCRGHITEPIGTHGFMKCKFDKMVKSEDTILLSLYKRVYPKWAYEPLPIEPLPRSATSHEEMAD
ncbi:unnamed protein product [Notodromas monacha]|uniref:Pre-rRNA-processing protein TSR1 homolog n=1 Tax=Notodromas monacha TaxID=399045 RepID=A0A7R9GEJ4_9CRUS|nr:unnamed protein product [Notodromas monacha]CAG0917933.1 unnamed protein product [Notodromas monacha]